MFRRRPTSDRGVTARVAEDPLLTADLPERVQTGRDRLAYQFDPALREALSEQELQAERKLAERLREHDRTEQLAEIETAEATAAEVRKTTTQIVRTEARDLTMSRRALADQRREASPHAQMATLYRIKRWSGRALAGVVAGSMLYSASNVQHNLAPGGPSEPLYWTSYLLEALISTVLVVFMVSGSAVARWKIIEGEKTIQRTEVALLVGSILLNTYPFLHRPVDWAGVAVHSVAPIMMGVALFGHTAVAKRMGAAIAKASLELSVTDDTDERLAELLARARTTVTQPAAPERGAEPVTDDAVLADFEREFDPAPEQAPHFPMPESADAQHHGQHFESAGSAGVPSTSPDGAAGSAPHYASAGSAGDQHFESAGALPAASAPIEPVVEQSARESAGDASVAEDSVPAPDRAVETSTDTAAVRESAGDAPAVAGAESDGADAVRTPRTTVARPRPASRTSVASRDAGAGSSPALAGRSVSALALASAGSAGGPGEVRAALTVLAEEVRARGVGRRLPLESVVRVLEMLSADASVNAVHEDTGVHRKTVERVRDTAAIVRAESGAGGRVIELRKHTERT